MPEGAAAFTTTGDSCTGSSLAQGASCTVTASFRPTSFGAVTATLTAASQTSPLPGATATAALTGSGVGHLYSVNQGQAATDGSVNLANPDGTNAVTLTNPGTLPFPQGVAVNANLLYVSVRGDLDNDPDFEPFILGAENDNLVSTVRVFVFQATGQDAQVPQQLAINANNPNDLFWKSGDGTIWRGNINDGSFQNIFPQQPTQARGMTVNANYVYWCTSRALQGDGTIWRATLVGSNPVQLAQNLTHHRGWRSNANYLYWANDGNSIMRAPLNSAFIPETIVTGQASRWRWRSTPLTSTGPTSATTQSGGPTWWAAPTPNNSFPARTTRSRSRSAPSAWRWSPQAGRGDARRGLRVAGLPGLLDAVLDDDRRVSALADYC